MSTSYNTTVKLYSGVPLMKNGTDVLLLAASAAEGVLAAKLTATYSAYYFERENRRYIQIDDIFGNLDGVNYISFANNSHGGKIYFGFVDRVIYVNDHNTQIEFTIDPFPTFFGDCIVAEYAHVLRNTPSEDDRGANLISDFSIETAGNVFTELARRDYNAGTTICYYAASDSTGATGLLQGTNIKIGPLNATLLQDILDHGGVIIGAYACPSAWASGAQQLVTYMDTVNVASFAQMGSYVTNKVKTGLYCKIFVTVNSTTKYYEPEEFTNPESASFGILRTMAPGPGLFIYPKNYRGLTDNLAEGIFAKFPSIQIAANSVYTRAQEKLDMASAAQGMLLGGMSGGLVGAIMGGASGLISSYVNELTAPYKAPTIYGHGEPITDADYGLYCAFGNVHADSFTLRNIDNFFRYYGYAVGGVRPKAQINLDDKAYLQTGNSILFGSEADDELNARIMRGIKIRKTLSTLPG